MNDVITKTQRHERYFRMHWLLSYNAIPVKQEISVTFIFNKQDLKGLYNYHRMQAL